MYNIGYGGLSSDQWSVEDLDQIKKACKKSGFLQKLKERYILNNN